MTSTGSRLYMTSTGTSTSEGDTNVALRPVITDGIYVFTYCTQPRESQGQWIYSNPSDVDVSPTTRESIISSKEEKKDMLITISAKDLFKEENEKYLDQVLSIMQTAILIDKDKMFRHLESHSGNMLSLSKSLLDQINTVKSAFMIGKGTDFIDKFNNRISSAISEIRSAWNGLDNVANSLLHHLYGFESINTELLTELRHIAKDEREIKVMIETSYRVQSISFIYKTEDIVLEYEDYKIKLGKFEITVNYHTNTGVKIWTYSDDPNPSEDGGYQHPHVSGGTICLGDAENNVNAYRQNGMISDLFEVLEILLKTYNPSSPYRTIEEWEGEYLCEGCGDRMPEDTYCRNCDKPFCNDCLVQSIEGRFYCESCAEDMKCDGCGKISSNLDHVVNGDETEMLCPECKTNNAVRCRECEKLIHVDTAVKCGKCDYLFCKGCTIEDADGYPVCAKCDSEN